MDDLTIQGQLTGRVSSERSKITKPGASVPARPVTKEITARDPKSEAHFPVIRKDLHSLRKVLLNLTDWIIDQKQNRSTLLHQSLKTVLAKIEQILQPAMLSGSVEDLASRIKAFVLASGIYFEKHMESALKNLDSRHGPIDFHELAKHPAIRGLMAKDIKPNLLVLNTLLDSLSLKLPARASNFIVSVKKVVEQVLSNIGEQQLIAMEKPSEPENFQLFLHHLLFEELDKDARLKVYYRKKGRREANQQPRLSLMVEMDCLGSVRTDFWMVDRNLSVTFFVENEEAGSRINEKQIDLEKKLSETFDTVAVNVVISKKKIDDFDSEDLMLSKEKIVNLKI